VDIHASSGVRTHDPSVGACEDNSCLRPCGHCDRRKKITPHIICRWFRDTKLLLRKVQIVTSFKYCKCAFFSQGRDQVSHPHNTSTTVLLAVHCWNTDILDGLIPNEGLNCFKNTLCCNGPFLRTRPVTTGEANARVYVISRDCQSRAHFSLNSVPGASLC
jgi:hypothetical protein